VQLVATVPVHRRHQRHAPHPGIGAQMGLSQERMDAGQFQQAMLDLAVNAGVILAIGIALFP
jgi:hypothetical protein